MSRVAPRSSAALHLVRHGKASPSGENYDVLSELGARQANLLGQHLGTRGEQFDSVYVGPLARHQDTWRAMVMAASACGVTWPEPVIIDALAEAPLVQLVRSSLMSRLSVDPELAQLVQAMAEPAALARGDDRLGPALRHMALLWMRGELASDGVESYPEFATRLKGALDAIASAVADGERALVVSSVGSISELLRQALGETAGESVARLSTLPNASVTELFRDAAGYRLGRLGDVSHLPSAELVTHI